MGYYVAGKSLDVGIKKVLPGECVPEALDFPENARRALVKQGFLIYVDEDLPGDEKAVVKRSSRAKKAG